MLRSTCLWALLLPASLLAACGDETNGTGGGGGGTGGGGDGGGGGLPVEACANVEALRATCQELPARFDASTTLEKGCYRASTQPVIAAGVTLTVSPGVTILFAEDTGIDVNEDRALVALGTAEEPICFTGDVAQRGSWDGLKLGRTEGDDNALDHVTIEYAGSTKSDAEAAAIKIVSDSRVARFRLTNTTVRESEGYGLYLVGSAEATAFTGNTFTKNGLGPASVDSDVAGLLDAGSTYAGNDVDEVTVRTNRITKNPIWAAIDVPFRMTGHLNVDVPWTISAPNTLVFSEGGSIDVSGDTAALFAVGTATAPILFTGAEKERGYWENIQLGNSNNAQNRFAYATIEYGGSTGSDFDGACLKATSDSHGVTLSLENTTIRECEGFGLYLSGSATLPALANNTYTNNTLGPASVGSEAVHQLDVSSSYTGNDVDRLRVRDQYVSQSVTWQDLGVPYELEGNMAANHAVWTLAPGVTLLMPQGAWISAAGDDTGFHAVGTAAKPITITGLVKTAGYWHSIIFDGSLNGANAIEYATIEYGGSTDGGGELGMIQAQSDSHGVVLSVKNSTIRHSARYGIWLGGYAEFNGDIESSNSFAGNAMGDVHIEP